MDDVAIQNGYDENDDDNDRGSIEHVFFDYRTGFIHYN
jgi:hypothetical protein